MYTLQKADLNYANITFFITFLTSAPWGVSHVPQRRVIRERRKKPPLDRRVKSLGPEGLGQDGGAMAGPVLTGVPRHGKGP